MAIPFCAECNTRHVPKCHLAARPCEACAAKDAEIARMRGLLDEWALGKTNKTLKANGKTNGFDRAAYQRDYMRRRRATQQE